MKKLNPTLSTVMTTMTLMLSCNAIAEEAYKFAHSGTKIVTQSQTGIGFTDVTDSQTTVDESRLVCGSSNDSYLELAKTGKIILADEQCESIYSRMNTLKRGEVLALKLKREVPVYEFVIDQGVLVSVTKTSEKYKRPKNNW